jgi:biopolymer transport protein ExbB
LKETILNLFEVISAAGWPIYPLMLCSILALAFIIERAINLRAEKIVPANLVDEAIAVSRTAVPSGEILLQLEHNSLLGEVLANGMRQIAANPRISQDELRAAMEVTGRSVSHRMEKFLTALGTISALGPLFGLLGTVVGMIEIFAAQGATGMGSNPVQLAHGISIALYNTAFGLMVAIPALIAWKFFRARVDDLLIQMELASEQFFRHLNTLRK